MPDIAQLFSDDLISPKVAASLPANYTIRSLRASDYKIGFLDVLRVLTTVGEIEESAWLERYQWMATQGAGSYYILVIEDTSAGKIVGTGALIAERKLYVYFPSAHYV